MAMSPHRMSLQMGHPVKTLGAEMDHYDVSLAKGGIVAGLFGEGQHSRIQKPYVAAVCELNCRDVRFRPNPGD